MARVFAFPPVCPPGSVLAALCGPYGLRVGILSGLRGKRRVQSGFCRAISRTGNISMADFLTSLFHFVMCCALAAIVFAPFWLVYAQ